MVSLRRLLPGILILCLAAPLRAQNPECASYTGRTLNVCNAAIDGGVIFHPVLGLLVSGGNPLLGSAKTLGGLPHFSLTLRANGTNVQLPDLAYDGTTTTVGAGTKTFIPSPVVEASVGLFGGLSHGLLAVDFLGSAELLPTGVSADLRVDSSATKIGSVALGFGFGGKVGVLSQQGPVPAVSVSVMRRNIPRIGYGDVPAGDRYGYSLDIHATNLRAMAGYKLSVLEVAAGLGWDKYTGTAKIDFRDPLTNAQQPQIDKNLDQSRTMLFANAALDFPVLKIGAEAGYQMGKTQSLATTFQNNDPSNNRFFASAGIRLAF